MWEARAVAGGVDELLAWVRQHAHADARVYRSADDRVVVIDESGVGLPEVAAELLARPAHVWSFERVAR